MVLCCTLDVERLLIPVATHPDAPFDILETYRREAADVLIEQVRECRSSGMDCETMLCEEGTRDGILHGAADARADLIAIGTHGRSGAGRALLGSVTEDVLRHSTLPVLTVRERSVLQPFRRIAVALDDSICAERALDFALQIATEDAAGLHLFHLAGGGFDLSKASRRVPDSVPSVSTYYEYDAGDAGLAICAFAERIKADLVAVGSHGRKGIARAFLGSVAETTVRHSPCPVLVARAA